ncbi:hypothetical protein [Pseudomonas cremoricolorata]|uniref:Uncharacterized protein n=1 Tax=Pseudomonas cremoricolorata TaxID=157783 RepID=A0A089WNS7_9PSED|nr:hypothetical protein [Pseudomonas cremoricolorata]AIR90216.1 hypothetical protein LK03_13340 [Pseudomonas cremoricolorata]
MNEQAVSLLQQILHQQQEQTDLMRTQNNLLRTIADQNVMLIDALAGEEEGDQDSEPSYYLDGTPCR